MRVKRYYGGILEIISFVVLLICAFCVPEPNSHVSLSKKSSNIAYDIVDTSSNLDYFDDINRAEIPEIAESFEYTPVYYDYPVNYTPESVSPAAISNYFGYTNYVSITGFPVNLVNGYLNGRNLWVPDYDAARYGSFIYGHNNILSGLFSIGIGSIIEVQMDGVHHTYQVGNIVNLAKADINMSDVINARYNGVNYSVSLMTCSGIIYGNGDASHRLLVFAYEI